MLDRFLSQFEGQERVFVSILNWKDKEPTLDLILDGNSRYTLFGREVIPIVRPHYHYRTVVLIDSTAKKIFYQATHLIKTVEGYQLDKLSETRNWNALINDLLGVKKVTTTCAIS